MLKCAGTGYFFYTPQTQRESFAFTECLKDERVYTVEAEIYLKNHVLKEIMRYERDKNRKYN